MPEHPEPDPDAAEWGRTGGLTAAANMTPAERQDRARQAANIRWARTGDRTAATAQARAGLAASYLAGADAAGVTDPAQRRAMAAAAERAHHGKMTRAAKNTRKRAREARAAQAAQLRGES